MNKTTFIILLLIIFTFQSCCLQRVKDQPKYSKLREISRISNPNSSFQRFTKKVIISENDKYVQFIFDKDSLELDKSYRNYTTLFSSGLVSNLVLGNSDTSLITILRIEEVKYCLQSRKIRIYKLGGGPKNEFGWFNYYIEIRNNKAHKYWNLEKFINKAKVTKLATLVLI